MTSKYRAVPTTVDGIRFASKREAKRYQELRLLEKAGEIRDLRLQVSFDLDAKPLLHGPGGTVGRYVADFVFYERTATGWQLTVEDAKGVKTPMYRWKKRHVEAQYGIEIREV